MVMSAGATDFWERVVVMEIVMAVVMVVYEGWTGGQEVVGMRADCQQAAV